MRSRRFLLLACVLVTLNLALWGASAAFGLQQISLPSLFGKALMRADVLLSNGQEWRVDRGVIASVTPTQLTLKEADGRLQPIAVSNSATNVVGLARTLPVTALGRGWHVLVIWPANGTATMVTVESRPAGKGFGGGRGRQHQ